MTGRLLILFSAFLIAGAACRSATAQEPKAIATQAWDLKSHATIHCVGLEWTITGDANHNATCLADYRKAGDSAWKKAMPLLRCDARLANCFAGSIFNLEPGSDYEIRLQLNDPDGGSRTGTLRIGTRPVPTITPGGRAFHVAPGNGGGDGSARAPFLGIPAAERAAQPGDVFLLRGGDYGVVRLSRDGAPGKPIAWKSAGEGAAILRGISPASWVWLEGLVFRQKAGVALQCDRFLKNDQTTCLAAVGRRPSHVVITRCRFSGFHYTMDLKTCSEFYIADNIIQGDNDPVTGGLAGEGIELNKTSGHIVAHNRISRTADCISYPGGDVDIYGNDLQDSSDDGIETDGGRANVRVWGNRITNAANNVFTFQPMSRGPWFFIRNQVVITHGKIWKFAANMGQKTNVDDRFVVLHNTFVFPNNASEFAQCLLNAYSRNNLYIATGDDSYIFRAAWNRKGGPGRTFTPDWMTDVDYDGFDWVGKPTPFVWDGKAYGDLASFAKALGIEKGGLRVKKEEIFENWAAPSAEVGSPPVNLVLKAGSAAVDAGDLVPNINDNFAGNAPDLGALELGRPLPHYGPRCPVPGDTAPHNRSALQPVSAR